MRIKETIKECGYTNKALAEKMGIARESLQRMLVSPSYPTLVKISTALGVPMWRLFVTPQEAAEAMGNGADDFVALVKCGDVAHVAHSLAELENIVAELKAK